VTANAGLRSPGAAHARSPWQGRPTHSGNVVVVVLGRSRQIAPVRLGILAQRLHRVVAHQ
jgi:hypothetical protein